MSDRKAAARFLLGKAATLLTVAVLLGLTLGSAVAQPPGGSRGGRGRGWNRDMWDAFRKAHRNAADKELLDLLRHPPIRQELKLDEDAHDHMRGLGQRLFDDLNSLPKDLDDGEMLKRVSDLLEKFGKEGFEYLETKIGKEGVERLESIYAQSRRWGAATNSRIAKKIGLEGDELKEFRDLAERLVEDMRESVRPEISEIMEDSSLGYSERRSRIERLFNRRAKHIDEKLKNRLSEQQQAKLLKLQGEPFDDLPGWRRPPPPPSEFERGGRGRGPGDRERKDDDGGPRSQKQNRRGSDGDPRPRNGSDKSSACCDSDYPCQVCS